MRELVPYLLLRHSDVEKIRVTACANEDDGLVGELIKKQPIPAEVAFAEVFEVSEERVIAVVRRHGFAFREQVDGFREAAHFAPRALDPKNEMN